MHMVQVGEGLDKEAFAQKAQAIYERKHKERLEETARGQVAAVDVESEDIFVGRTALEAAMKARKKFPDRLFYFIRIGYPAVHSLKGTGKRISIPEKA
jgi:hypothetical protein